MTEEEKKALIGKEVRAADGGDYGHRITGYDEATDDFSVFPIRWSTGEPLEEWRGRDIDTYKASYRYILSEPRDPLRPEII